MKNNVLRNISLGLLILTLITPVYFDISSLHPYMFVIEMVSIVILLMKIGIIILPAILIFILFTKRMFNRYEYLMFLAILFISELPGMTSTYKIARGPYLDNVKLNMIMVASNIILMLGLIAFTNKESDVNKSKTYLYIAIILSCITNILFPWVPLD